MSFGQEWRSDAIHVPAGEGIQRWVAGDTYSVKLTSEMTGGALSFIEASVPPGAGPVAHVHKAGAEGFYLLDGELEFLNGDKTFTARSGDLVYVPAGIRHRFRNKHVHTAKMLFFFTPAGLERSFLNTGDEAVPGTPPPAWDADRFVEAGEILKTLNINIDFFPEENQ
ncbi:cupin domain-containing protein [Kutzneria sp. NPDC051319]|uniref:cupin domain-containing protein n=1 Tax=Kutzneria sp. NPDC051319 TaxID=3155047 RepID=UPI00341A88AE